MEHLEGERTADGAGDGEVDRGAGGSEPEVVGGHRSQNMVADRRIGEAEAERRVGRGAELGSTGEIVDRADRAVDVA